MFVVGEDFFVWIWFAYTYAIHLTNYISLIFSHVESLYHLSDRYFVHCGVKWDFVSVIKILIKFISGTFILKKLAECGFAWEKRAREMQNSTPAY
jgi:hypothetical protein